MSKFKEFWKGQLTEFEISGISYFNGKIVTQHSGTYRIRASTEQEAMRRLKEIIHGSGTYLKDLKATSIRKV